MNEQEATRAVARELYAEDGMWRSRWESLQMDTLENFVKDAKSVLGDQTEIEGEALRKADWAVLYAGLVSIKYPEERS